MVSARTLIFNRFAYFSLLLLFVLVFTQKSLTGSIDNSQNSFASTIAGIVYDQNRNPLSRVDVELSNAAVGGSTSLRTRTDDTGRYQFDNLPDGRYRIKVMPFRYNLQDQTEEVIVHTINLLGSGSGYFPQDFYLASKKGGLGDTVTGVIFSQEVPKEAEKLYEKAMDDISDKKSSDGMEKLIEAIKLFPNYYAALQRLGIELLKTEQYMDATKLFIRAAGVNPKSSRSLYYMGFALNKLNKSGKNYNKAALKALENAIRLAPASWEVVYLIGKIEREEGNFAKAEKHLLKAKKLADVRVPHIHKELAQLYGNNLKQYDKAADELELYLKASKKKKDEKTKKQIANLREKAKKGS